MPESYLLYTTARGPQSSPPTSPDSDDTPPSPPWRRPVYWRKKKKPRREILREEPQKEESSKGATQPSIPSRTLLESSPKETSADESITGATSRVTEDESGLHKPGQKMGSSGTPFPPYEGLPYSDGEMEQEWVYWFDDKDQD